MRRRMLAAVLVAAVLIPQPAEAATPPHFDVSPSMLAAMRRDLKLDDAQIAARLRTEAAAPVIEKRLQSRLGSAFAGAWIPQGASKLTVAVTTAKAEAIVRAEGATPILARTNAATLAATRSKLDRQASKAAAAGVRGWYVDVPGNRVVVLAKPGAEPAARRFAQPAGQSGVIIRREVCKSNSTNDYRDCADWDSGAQYRDFKTEDGHWVQGVSTMQH